MVIDNFDASRVYPRMLYPYILSHLEIDHEDTQGKLAREMAYASLISEGYKFRTNASISADLLFLNNSQFTVEKLVEKYKSEGLDVVVRDDAYDCLGRIVSGSKAILVRKPSTPANKI